MPDVTPAAMLGATPMFRGLAAKDLEELARHMVPRTYRRGESIFHRGDPAGALHYIETGTVKVTLTTEDGKETVLALFGPGACFGEISALDGGPRPASVTATEPAHTLALLRDDLLTFIRARPDLALEIIGLLASRLRRADERLEDAYFLDLDGRLARCLLELATERGTPVAGGVRIALSLSQTDLAAMLGSTRVSVNRLLGAYQDASLIALDSESILIKDLAAVSRRIER